MIENLLEMSDSDSDALIVNQEPSGQGDTAAATSDTEAAAPPIKDPASDTQGQGQGQKAEGGQ